MELDELVLDFGQGFRAADGRRPQAVSLRSKKPYQPGLGPHAETAAVALVLAELRSLKPGTYGSAKPVPYPGSALRCDLGIGEPLEWVIEIKMARALGDNGKLDDTYLKDMLSPYAPDHSALGDSIRLRQSRFSCRKAVLIYGFDYPDRPLDPALDALELLMASRGPIGKRRVAAFRDLAHPIHQEGRVVGWEILLSPSDR